MPKKTKTTDTSQPPIYLNTADMAKLLGVSANTLKIWRLGNRRGQHPRLVEGAHWVAFGGSRTLYHRELMLDFIANYNSPHLHQKAIEKFLADLPSSRAVGD